MIQLPQYLLWIGATLLAAYVAALGWRLGVARRFPFLTAYLVLSLGAELSRLLIFERWGFTAELWMNFYYGSDLLLAVALYFVILELQRRLLPAQLWRLLHRCSLAIVGLWTVVSYAEIWKSDTQRLMLCAYELSSSLWFVSLGLILVLWGIIYVRDLPRGVAAEMVQVWGIYFLLMGSTYVFFYFFHNLPPSAPRLHLEIPVMAEVWLPLGLGFAILNKSQNDRSAANLPG
jgi:hypothetical protein